MSKKVIIEDIEYEVPVEVYELIQGLSQYAGELEAEMDLVKKKIEKIMFKLGVDPKATTVH